MGTLSDAARAKRLAELAERNRTALRLLHMAAQANSDGDPDFAEVIMLEAADTLRPRPWWRW